MPSKQEILDAVAQALDAMGVSSGEGEDMYGEDLSVGGENTVPVWSQLQAGTLGQGNGQIHDKSKLMAAITEQDKPARVDAYGLPVAGDEEEMMSAMGIV